MHIKKSLIELDIPKLFQCSLKETYVIQETPWFLEFYMQNFYLQYRN